MMEKHRLSLTIAAGLRASAMGLVLALTLGAIQGGSASADTIYKSTDADGHVVYSDRPRSIASR